jgi:hypothetical protein
LKQRAIPHSTFVRCVGENLETEIEKSHDPARVDHVWIRMETELHVPVFLSVNTLSWRNGQAGFDPRVRVGIVQDTYKHPPRLVFEDSKGFDYAEYEESVAYEYQERAEIESLLISRCERARYLEVWGLTYQRRHQGIHQIHCRWASCAVNEHVTGKDGALRFYYGNYERELVLFKFCGQ